MEGIHPTKCVRRLKKRKKPTYIPFLILGGFGFIILLVLIGLCYLSYKDGKKKSKAYWLKD